MPDEQTLEIAGRRITVTSPDKVFFPERGETKLDLVRYYLAVGEPLLRAAGGRPTLMQRFPRGARGQIVLPEARPQGRARVAADDDRHHAERDDLPRARACRHGARGLGGQPGLPRLPRVALSPRPRRGHGRAAPRPRPAAGHRLRRGARRRGRGARGCWTSSGSSGTRRPRATGASTSTSGSSRAGTRTRCGPQPSPPRASSSAAGPS